MNKYDALFVRALKSNSPDFRIRRLYSKLYHHDFSDHHLAQVLSKIVKDYNLMSVKDWIEGLNPVNGWKYGIADDAPYYERCVRLMTSCIRLTCVDVFDNYPYPAKFRSMK